jgi:hypothetical protein
MPRHSSGKQKEISSACTFPNSRFHFAGILG